MDFVTGRSPRSGVAERVGWFYRNTVFSITKALYTYHQKIEDEDEYDKDRGNLTGLLASCRPTEEVAGRLKIADYFAKLLGNQ